MIKAILTVLSILFTWSIAFSAEFGQTDTTGNNDHNALTSERRGNTNATDFYTASTGDVVTALHGYAFSANTGDWTFDIAIYEVTGGVPDALVGAVQTITGSTQTDRIWVSVTGLNISLTNGVEYTICVGNGTNGASPRYNNSAPSNGFSRANSGGSALVDPFNHVVYGTGRYILYATYTEGGAAEPIPTRKRRLGEHSAKNTIYCYMPTLLK